MKKILLAILVFFGLKISAQIMPCDSISYGTSSTINYPLILSGSISFTPDSISWMWSVCDNNMCYSGNGANASFGQVSLTDTLKVCYNVFININGMTYTCAGCDTLIYNPNSYQWESKISNPIVTSITNLPLNTISNSKIYDMLGRELTEIPVGTIYIRNGKLHITK